MTNSKAIAICVVSLAAASNGALCPAWAGPPFVTDDPEPVEFQHWEINYAISKSWRQGEASAGVPSIDINYGVVQDVQFHVQPRFSYERTGQESRTGIDDTEIGVKYRFLSIEHGDSSTMLGVYPIYELPTGDTKLGPDRGRGQLLLPLWIQHDFDKWTFYGGPAYRINPGADNKNTWFFGATALRKVTESLQLGAELFHQTSDTADSKSASGFNLGGTYNLAQNYSLLFSAGRGLQNASSTNQLSAYLALQVLR